jgi:hypothetical protein
VRSDAERVNVQYVSARLPALRRPAYLLCRETHRAEGRTGSDHRAGRRSARPVPAGSALDCESTPFDVPVGVTLGPTAP